MYDQQTKKFIRNGEVALLQQTDVFFSKLTPKETLHLATFLQLSKDEREREHMVAKILSELGLTKVQNLMIGENEMSSSQRLSGGERRRLSVGTYVLKCTLCQSFFFKY